MNDKNGFSIITITCRSQCIDNIIQNYIQQDFVNKELIVIINNDKVNIESFNKYVKTYPNISIYKLSQQTSLGECLNFAIDKSNYDLIAKFDDDDYYGKFYLGEAYHAFLEKDCEVVGKFDAYYYFEKFRMLMLLSNDKFYNRPTGSTICFRKEITKEIRFANISSGEDAQFYDDCIQKGYKIYITSKFNHIIFRAADHSSHTCKLPAE